MSLSGRIDDAGKRLDEAISLARELQNPTLIAQTIRFQAAAIRRLGGIRWQWLRRLAYAIGLWPTEPIRCRPVFPATSAYWGLVPDDRQGDLWVSRSVGSRAAASTEAPGTYPIT